MQSSVVAACLGAQKCSDIKHLNTPDALSDLGLHCLLMSNKKDGLS